MARDLITVGMPVHNGEKTISCALDSLLAQTHQDFEIFISDNASTDRTHEICVEYESRDARIRYIRRESNVGAIANFNSLLSFGEGLLFMWAGADDLWEPGYMEELLGLLRADPGAALAFCEMFQRELPSGPDFLGKSLLGFNAPESMARRMARFVLFPEVESKGSLIYGLIRRDAIARIGLLSQNHTLFRLAIMGRFAVSPRRLFYKGFVPIEDIEKIMTSPLEILLDFREYTREVAGAEIGPARSALVDSAALLGCLRRTARNILGRMLVLLGLRKMEPVYYRVLLKTQGLHGKVSRGHHPERKSR